jgi:hypothetical protein
MTGFLEELIQGSSLMGYDVVTLVKGRGTGVPKDRDVFSFKGQVYCTA